MKHTDDDVGAALAMALQQPANAAADSKRPWHINQSNKLCFLSLGLIREVNRHQEGKQNTPSTKCSWHSV